MLSNSNIHKAFCCESSENGIRKYALQTQGRSDAGLGAKVMVIGIIR